MKLPSAFTRYGKLPLFLLGAVVIFTVVLAATQCPARAGEATCVFCGSPVQSTDLAVVSPFDGTLRANVNYWSIVRCDRGHLTAP